MKPFDAAYLRLTAWYVGIIMVISLLFSVWVYNQARSELRSGLNKVIELKPMANESNSPFGAVVDQRLADSHDRLLNQLVFLNLGVLMVGSVASYWLARRTMRPIEESVEAQERFTADASHELRTPLAAMKAEIEVSLRSKKLTTEEAITLLKSNLEEVERLGGLAEGLLTLTQSNDGTNLVPVDIDDIAGKTINRLRPLAAAKEIELTVHLQPVRAMGDEMSLDKIVGVLLDNAIKYSTHKTTISLRSFYKDGHSYLTVKDEGVGIKASELPHIFDRFYRADTSRSKLHVMGHGLGLSIAQKLAERMDGVITATSTPGQGSTFTLRLPRATS